MSRTTLICLPFAGAGASFFRKWQQRAPDGLTVVAIQLPGREERLADPPHTDAAVAAEEALAWVTPRLDGGRVVVFGHSMGALLAYELANRLTEQGVVPVERLYVSGAAGPREPRRHWAAGLSDVAFMARVGEMTGYTHPAMHDEEMRELLLPALRADVELNGTYRPSRDKPADFPITSVRGRADDLVSAEQAARWAEETTAGFAAVEAPGGHMYLSDRADTLLRLVADDGEDS